MYAREDDASCFPSLGSWLFSDGARQHEGARPAGGADHHRRCGFGYGADLESNSYAEADDQRAHWGFWGIEVRHEALHRITEDDVRTAAKSAQGRPGGAGDGHRGSGPKPAVRQL